MVDVIFVRSDPAPDSAYNHPQWCLECQPAEITIFLILANETIARTSVG